MTNYEIWQMEKYGNVLPGSDQQPEETETLTTAFQPEDLVSENKKGSD